MNASVLECPRCGAALTPPSRFARSTVCEFCGTTVRLDPSVVSRARFRAAFEAWNDPAANGYDTWTTLEGVHYAPLRRLAEGDTSVVYLAERARFPSERVLLKVLRDAADAPRLDHEVALTGRLQAQVAADAPELARRLPDPVAAGPLHDLHAGGYGAVFRWTPGFVHTLEDVRAAWPGGVAPQVGPWLWRRLLEILHVVHEHGVCHGAVLPQHVLVQDGEHGARLAGFVHAGAEGTKVERAPARHPDLYPDGPKVRSRRADLIMSARCVAFALGGDGRSGRVPDTIPAPLAGLLAEVAADNPPPGRTVTAWQLRETVGEIARACFGAPSFHPLILPTDP